MPGYILHMLHGELFLKKYGVNLSASEKDQFRIGILMPDSNKTIKATIDESHFYSAETKEKALWVPDLNNFPYRGLIKNPFVLGYCAHLYLDKLFFEEYFPSCVKFLDQNNHETDLDKEAINAKILKSGITVPKSTLYSEEYLYGDYTMINKFIIKKYCLTSIPDINLENPISEVNLNNIYFVREAISKFINESTANTEMKIFSIDTLETAIEKYSFGFAQWVEGIKSLL